MITVILHLALAFINLTGVAAAYLVWRKKGENSTLMGYFLLFFIFFIAYNLCLSLPYLFFGNSLELMAVGYNLGIVFIFLLLLPMYKIIISYILKMGQNQERFFQAMFFIVGLSVFIIQSVDLKLPRITQEGIIIWNNNFVAGLMTSVCATTASIFWLVLYLRYKPQNTEKREELKASLFVFGATALAISSIYFVAYSLSLIVISFIFVFLGSLLISVLMFLSKKQSVNPNA